MLSTVLIYRTDNLSLKSIMYIPGTLDKSTTWEPKYYGWLTLELTIMVNGKLKTATILDKVPTTLTPEKGYKIPKEIRENEEACKKEMVKLLPTWEEIDDCNDECLKVRFVYNGSEKLSGYLKTLEDLGYMLGNDIFRRIDQHIIHTYKEALDENAGYHTHKWIKREQEVIRKEYEDFKIAEANKEFGLDDK